MAIQVNNVENHGEFWRVSLRVYEGVYHREEYIVRLVDVPAIPVALSKDDAHGRIRDFVLSNVQQHIRRGSLPPSGVQIAGQRIWH